jgi:hypothetical protein
MNKRTQETIFLINELIKFNDNLVSLPELMPIIENDVDLISPYVDFEIQKALKDIIHTERL